MKNWLKKNKINLLIIFIWAICSFTLIFFHEQWRDEAQQWLIARDCNIAELFSQLKYEGHFMLWYLILMPFAKLGFPYITQNFISWFICLIAVLIINLKSPFKTYQKIFFTFSLPMIYLYPVISRCYCLIPLAISLIAWFYKDRKTKPIRYVLAIALLANTHVIMLGMVGVLLLEFFIEFLKGRKTNSKSENKKIILSFILVAILLFLTALPLFGCLTTNKTVGNNNSLLKNIYCFFYNVIILIPANFSFFGNNLIFAILISWIIACIILIYTENNKKCLFQFLLIILWQLFIYTFIWSAGTDFSNQRIPVLILIIMFFVWTSKNDIPKGTISYKIFKIFLIIVYILYFINNIFIIANEINSNYSNSYLVADYINENIPEGSIFINAKEPSMVSSIIPYLKGDYKFYYLQSQNYFTFITFDETLITNLDENFGIDNLKEIFGENKTLYYIYNPNTYYVEDETFLERIKDNLTVVFENDILNSPSYLNEDYILYKITL